MEASLGYLVHHLLAGEWLSLRDVVRLVLLSGLFTAAAWLAFPRNAPSRRVLLLAAVTALTLLPWVLSRFIGHWSVSVEELPAATLSTFLPNFLVWAWIGVAFVLVSTYVVQLVREIRAIKSLPPISDPEADALHLKTAELASRLDLKAPELRLGRGPCSLTLGGAIIVLPRQWSAWDQTTLDSVLAHELVHIQRRDDLWLLLTRMLQLLYWWMPWLKYLYQNHIRVMEESCDDAASELLGTKVEYVGALVDVAREDSDHDPASPQGVMSMHAHHLVARVGRFANERIVELDTGGVYWCVTVIVLVVAAVTSVEPVVRTAVEYQATPALSVGRDQPRGDADLARIGELSYYPQVDERLELPVNISRSERARVQAPEYAPPVIYPGAAIHRRVEGTITISFSVNKDGSVSKARVVRAEPPGVFDEAALRAVNNTRYAPGYTTGRLVNVTGSTNRDRPPPSILRHFRFELHAER